MALRRLAPKEQQPESFAFTDENLAWARAQLAKFPEGREASAVIPILWRAQEQNDGWVSEAAIRAVADLLGMPHIRALEIATFYTMFQLQPVGRKAHIQVCGTTPCRLRGAEELLEVCKNRIHHDAFHLSGDGDFSWEEVECLGACVNAPMVMIWKDTYEDLTAESFGNVLDGFAKGQPPRPGPQNGRQFSAPYGGPTTLKSEDVPKAANDAGGSGAALRDGDAKRPGEAANVRESPAPEPSARDATRTDPPSGDPVPRGTDDVSSDGGSGRNSPGGSRREPKS